MISSFVLLCFLIFAKLSKQSVDFSYDGEYGPAHWGEKYDTCVGKHQSPINIQEHDVKNVQLPPLNFTGLYIPRSSILTNNGHTVMLNTNESEAAIITGGPLGEEIYAFEQLHFHWGENDTLGSEDLLNNVPFAMELHAVFYKKEYGSMKKAMEHSDGLAVLAYFYDIGIEENPSYNSIVKALPNVEREGSKEVLKKPLILGEFLMPKSMNDYFTYNGSLTTPPCLEIVTWIDFKEPQYLSHTQIEAFRDVKMSDGQKLTHNFRPVQPLEDRIVFHNVVFEKGTVPKKKIPSKFDHKYKKNGQHLNITGISLPVLMMLAVFLLLI